MHTLDGGLSNALEERGHDLSGGEWTARVLRHEPDAIVAVHREYFAAGADVATTASYQSRDPGLIRLSVDLAREAADGVPGRLVAGSVGPFGALLADGSEYRGRYGVTAAAIEYFHRPRIEALLAAEPDLLAVETIPDTDEAEVLCRLLAEYDHPAWLSYSIDGDRTCAGQRLEDAFAIPAQVDAIVAIGVNCCAPAEVLPALRLVAATGKAGVAYPNAGEVWDAEAQQWLGTTTYDVAHVPQWIEAGAEWIGGCCRVGPAAIGRVAEQIRSARETGGAGAEGTAR
ncbi:homocysteine S-methyltransferase [Aeromicrobium duanguangcaii]|uniref:Homocysteine S-methyltransferase n=1 Tax=Aeromicrobium duanguangcaii TaxID=2968086 RepID=A0ABY5KIS2_9ACTN|nr:homocysteine S-methyltransferase [Aeromicrobium duanguangcaii]MCD9155087.1 homocysteine S-methyltransferase [Aeromicrobium duanguangcaii]UUI68258.1 homocysteine S-methyltransferase [Aeromicrobium duanguangcaii]